MYGNEWKFMTCLNMGAFFLQLGSMKVFKTLLMLFSSILLSFCCILIYVFICIIIIIIIVIAISIVIIIFILVIIIIIIIFIVIGLI